MHRLYDVLDALLPDVLERVREPVADMVANRARDAHAAQLCQGLQPSSDVDTVAVDVVAVNDHVAQINADAEYDALVLGHIGVAVSHRSLDLKGAADSIDDTGEFRQYAVAGSLDERPRCSAIFGSTSWRRCAFRRSSVPSSSAPISREYPATSAARIAARRRWTGCFKWHPLSCTL